MAESKRMPMDTREALLRTDMVDNGLVGLVGSGVVVVVVAVELTRWCTC